jgi:hypothetical protein
MTGAGSEPPWPVVLGADVVVLGPLSVVEERLLIPYVSTRTTTTKAALRAATIPPELHSRPGAP